MFRLLWASSVATALGSSHFLGKEGRKLNATNASTMSLVVASCSAYPKCVALGLTSGTCCPSTGRDGKMLDCCEEGPTACSAYSACVEEGHTEGTCCTPGSKLDCCQEHPTSCSAYAKCAAAGLKEGACCPSKEGIMLDCCYSAMLPKPAPIPAGAQCEIYPDCVDLQLKSGACCPTSEGVVLDCCSGGSYADQAPAKPAGPAEEPLQEPASGSSEAEVAPSVPQSPVDTAAAEGDAATAGASEPGEI